MARGDFLRGLSEGIFERQGQLRQDQEAKDFQQKQDVVRMLTGLADKIEPDSLPLLLGHVWDTMGIKKQSSGKGLRGFLDAFSGVPNRTIEDQLGSKLKEVTDGMVGPQAAKDIRTRGALSQKGIPGLMQAAPNSAYGQKAAADAQGLKNKMVFRDPYQQKISEIEARYGAQLENQRARQEEAHNNAMLKQQGLYDLKGKQDKDRYERQTNKAIDELAKTYMTNEDIISLPVNQRWTGARQKAMDTLSEEKGLEIDNLRKNLEVKGAIIDEKRNNLKSGGSPSVQVSKDRLAYTKDKDLEEMEANFSKHDQTVKTLTQQLEEKGKALDAFAKTMKGMTREQLATSNFAAMGKNPVSIAVEEYNKVKRELETAQSQSGILKQQIDKRRGTKTATPPPKAQKQSSLITPTPRDGVPLDRVRARQEQIESRGHKPGDTVEYGPKKYRVGELKNGWYTLERIQ
jgi:hypothetical protein